MEREEFAKFLALSSDDRLKYLLSGKLSWWRRMRIKRLNRWWTSMRKANPDIEPYILWESIAKGRF